MSTPNSVYGSALSQGDPARHVAMFGTCSVYEPALSQGDPASGKVDRTMPIRFSAIAISLAISLARDHSSP
jgi:hypothetical protein